MEKTMNEYFRDWEEEAFGFGYGSGETYTIPALKGFLELCDGRNNSYDYERLEKVLTPAITWFLINLFGKLDIIQYGTSPRFAWLTAKGKRLKEFVSGHSTEELLEILDYDESYNHCYPDACNCGENGYEESVVCNNPFWLKTPVNKGEEND